MSDKKQKLIWKLMALYKEKWDEEMLWDFVETQLYLNNQSQDIEEKIKEFKGELKKKRKVYLIEKNDSNFFSVKADFNKKTEVWEPADKKKFNFALKINRWPVNWFNEKKDKENERKKRIQKLYPSVNKM